MATWDVKFLVTRMGNTPRSASLAKLQPREVSKNPTRKIYLNTRKTLLQKAKSGRAPVVLIPAIFWFIFCTRTATNSKVPTGLYIGGYNKVIA
jgi:hypothetical protein